MKLSSMKIEKAIREEDDKRYFKDAWMEYRNGLRIIHLKGSPYEVGYQHGVLLSDEIRKGAVNLYADPLNGGRKTYSPVIWALRRYLSLKIYNPLHRNQPKELLDQLKGIAEGSGVPYKTIFKANHHTAINRANRIIGAFAQKYTKIPFNVKNLKDRCVQIEFSQGSGVE